MQPLQPSQGIVDLINSILREIDCEKTITTTTESRSYCPISHWSYSIVTSNEHRRVLTLMIEEYFGQAIKAMGQSVRAISRPIPRNFLPAIGNIWPNQKLYVKDIDNNLIDYLAIWPWNDSRTSTLHIGTYTDQYDVK